MSSERSAIKDSTSRRPKPTALQRATSYLARRLVPESRLRRYLLEKGYGREEVDAAVAHLKEGGFLREENWALSRARALVERRAYWGRALAAKLKADGYDEAARSKAEAWARENFSEGEAARASLARRYGETWHAAPPRRVASFLERHGFSPSLIADLLREARRRAEKEDAGEPD